MGDEGGVWSIIKNKTSRMECVKHNTTFGHNFMNADGIEYFKSVYMLITKISIGQNIMTENYIENFASVQLH